MSTIACFKQISSEVLERVLKDTSLIPVFIYRKDFEKGDEVFIVPPEEDIAEIDIDKAWHAIHFLLTGQSEGGDFPLGNAVRGKEKLDVEVGYTNVSYLFPSEVEEVAQALSKITEEELIARFNPELLNERHIYPGTWEAQKQVEPGVINDEQYISIHYQNLVNYYKDASQRGNGMLFYLT